MKNPSLFALFTSLSLCLPSFSLYLCEKTAESFFSSFLNGKYLHAAYSFLCIISFLLYGIFLYMLAAEKAAASKKERFAVGYLSFFSLFTGFLSEYFCFSAPVPAVFFTTVFGLCAGVLAKILREKSRAVALAFLPLAVCVAKLMLVAARHGFL